MIKVRYMRPLETLHDNLCFKILDDFLTRMINDRYSPYDHDLIKSISITDRDEEEDDVILTALTSKQ